MVVFDLNRSAEQGFKKRNFNKLLGSSIWFQKKRKDVKGKESKNKRKAKKTMKKSGQIRVKSVIMVPKTTNSLLSRRLQEMEMKLSSITKEKVKIQEVGSVSVKQLLTSSDIWSGSACLRDQCLSCADPKAKKHKNCYKPSILYEIYCRNCLEPSSGDNNDINEEGSKDAEAEEEGGSKYEPKPKAKAIKYAYTGHSRRSAWERCQGHMKLWQAQDDGSALHNHEKDKHPNEKPQYVMSILRFHKSTFKRRLHECVRLHRESQKENVVVLNSRSERADYYGIPRLSLMIRPPDGDLETVESKEKAEGVVAAPHPTSEKGNQEASVKSPEKVPTSNSNISTRGKVKLKFQKTWLDNVKRRSKGENK